MRIRCTFGLCCISNFDLWRKMRWARTLSASRKFQKVSSSAPQNMSNKYISNLVPQLLHLFIPINDLHNDNGSAPRVSLAFFKVCYWTLFISTSIFSLLLTHLHEILNLPLLFQICLLLTSHVMFSLIVAMYLVNSFHTAILSYKWHLLPYSE